MLRFIALTPSLEVASELRLPADAYLDTESTLFFVALFKDVSDQSQYKTHSQEGWIVHTRLP